MKKHFKGVLAALMLIFVLAVSSFVTAAPTVNIEVNDIPVSTSETLYVERGETVEVEVVFTSDVDMDSARVKAWVGGYEHKDLEDRSEIKDIQANLKDREVLKFDIPEDMDASEIYTLNIQIYDKTSSFEYAYNLKIEEVRHNINIIDVIVRPTSKVLAGNAIFGNVRVENFGDKKEEDLKVVFKIPDIGVTQTTYIDELTAHEIDNEDEEDSASSDDVYLQIPSDAKSGIYDMQVDVYYNGGRSKVSETIQVEIVGDSSSVLSENTLLSIDSDTKDIVQGSENSYKVMIANTGDSAQIFSIEVAGEEMWGGSRVEPSFVNIAKDGTGEVLVYVKADETSGLGKQMFTLKIKSGSFVIAEKTLYANIVEDSSFGALKRALIIGFSVLVIVLVLLALIIAFNKMREDDDEEPGEIPTSPEGQAYYHKY